MAFNENGQTTNCGKPYAHIEHSTDTVDDPFADYCDGILWTPVQ